MHFSFSLLSYLHKSKQPGSDFSDIPDVIVVYISEFDIIGEWRTIYHVQKVIAETGQIIDDGTKYIYVNTVVDDGTDISSLMSCFTKKEFENPKFPILSKAVKYLKTTEGGLNSMCTVMQHYEEIAEQRGKRLLLFEMVQDGDIDVKKGALKTNLSEDEFLKEMKLAGFKPPIK